LVYKNRSLIFNAFKLRAFNWSLYTTQFFPQLNEDEFTYPQNCQIIDIDRLSAKKIQNYDSEIPQDLSPQGHRYYQLKQSVFGQMYNALRTDDKKLRQSTVYVMDEGQKRAFRVNFKGEGVTDHGGPYSQVLTDCCSELQSHLIDLFIPTPNNKSEHGKNQDHFMINPSFSLENDTSGHLSQALYRFIGQIIGIAIRSNVPLPLRLAVNFWKPLVDEELDIKDIESVDFHTAKLFTELSTVSENDFTTKFTGEGKSLHYTIYSQKKEREELIHNGKNITVTWENRPDYIQKVLAYKISEGRTHLENIKDGIGSIIPHDMLLLFNWEQFEEIVCGSSVIDINVLKNSTLYELVDTNEPHIKYFWDVLEEFDSEKRSRFLQFVWARTRIPSSGLPLKFKIQKSHKQPADKYLPTTQTCFFSISLPEYSSHEITRQQLTYAINCVDMDNDFTIR